jgi:S-adenosylmethionine hydrolase
LKKRKALQDEEGDENNLAPPAEVHPAASDVGQQLRVEQVRSVQRMQRQFQGRIIRRTTASKDHLGNSIVNLPPYRIIEGQIKLTDREMAVISELAEKAKDS